MVYCCKDFSLLFGAFLMLTVLIFKSILIFDNFFILFLIGFCKVSVCILRNMRCISSYLFFVLIISFENEIVLINFQINLVR